MHSRNSEDQNPGPFIRGFHAALENISARYVRVQAQNIGTIPAGHPSAGVKAWLFADEIVVNGTADTGKEEARSSDGAGLAVQGDRVANDAGNKLPSEGETQALGVSGVGSGRLYDEAYRPQFHLTYKKGWLSDINGLFHYDGEYHFFSQHCPAGPGLDYLNTYWDHAVSKDLIHWTELEPALAPDKDGPAFSGASCVVDWRNTSGLQTGKDPVICAFYTAARYMLPDKQDGVQSLAYTNDCGYSWTKYAGNPVLPAITHYNRDPKVFWHEPSQKWIMALSLSCAVHWLAGNDGDYRFAFFSSSDLKQWQEMSRFDMLRGLDCTDMFELPVDGDAANQRWVLWAGDCTHAIGTFDGTRFVATDGIYLPLLTWEENGANGYASQTFSNLPKSEGRCIQIGWLRTSTDGSCYPGMPFNQQALFPVELTLRTTPEGIALCRQPIREIAMLHDKQWQWRGETLRPGEDLLSDIRGELFEVRVLIEPDQASAINLAVRGAQVRYDVTAKTLTALGKTIPVGSADGRLRLQLLIDRATLEIFADDGRTSMSLFLPPRADEHPLSLTAKGGAVTASSLTVWEMKSIWQRDYASASKVED